MQAVTLPMNMRSWGRVHNAQVHTRESPQWQRDQKSDAAQARWSTKVRAQKTLKCCCTGCSCNNACEEEQQQVWSRQPVIWGLLAGLPECLELCNLRRWTMDESVLTGQSSETWALVQCCWCSDYHVFPMPAKLQSRKVATRCSRTRKGTKVSGGKE